MATGCFVQLNIDLDEKYLMPMLMLTTGFIMAPIIKGGPSGPPAIPGFVGFQNLITKVVYVVCFRMST